MVDPEGPRGRLRRERASSGADMDLQGVPPSEMLHYAAFSQESTVGVFRRLAAAAALAVCAIAALRAPDVAAAADPNKVVRAYFPAAETGFDPARMSDNYSATIAEVIFERLLTYDYLARPAKLAP